MNDIERLLIVIRRRELVAQHRAEWGELLMAANAVVDAPYYDRMDYIPRLRNAIAVVLNGSGGEAKEGK